MARVVGEVGTGQVRARVALLLFTLGWLVILWGLVAIVAAYAYLVGDGSQFRYVGF